MPFAMWPRVQVETQNEGKLMHCKNQPAHVSQECHAAAFTKDRARTIQASAPAVTFCLSSALKKLFSCVMALTTSRYCRDS